MLDILLRGGKVVDGTGSPARRADLGIRNGRVAYIGPKEEDSRQIVDIDGLVITPGFVDIHTHYDVQMLWDSTASPSPLHGVTTVIGGNCGFSIAPLGDAEDAEYVMNMMAVVEGMPLAALRGGPKWDWHSFGEFLGHLEGRIAVNAGFLVGHSTLRRAAMGSDAVGGQASKDQLSAMVRLTHEAMDDGALGLSSSLGEAHWDGDGNPVPSRAANRDEMLALSHAVREHAGTTLEFIPAMGPIPVERVRLMAEMSLVANRPLNWNLLGSLAPSEIHQEQLAASNYAEKQGARVVALTLPDLLRMRASRPLEDLPGWGRIAALPDDERRQQIARPEVREQLRDGFKEAAIRGLTALASWDLLEIAEATSPSTERYVGRTIADLSAELGLDPVDVLIDVVLAERLLLNLIFPSLAPTLGSSQEGWKARSVVWMDERTVLGGSDAGAHLDVMCHANYTTSVLGGSVRDRGLLSLEEAVRQMTDIPARLYGLRGRGRIAEGWWADLVVFDPERIGSLPVSARYDLPADSLRLYAEATGIEHVYVNGTEIVRGQSFLDEVPGMLLRSGRDTDTVSVLGG